MAESLFNKLQILPVPQKKRKFKVKLEKGKIALQTKIMNKTSEDFDMTAILKNLRRRVKLNQPIPIALNKPSSKLENIPPPLSKIQEESAEPTKLKKRPKKRNKAN